MSNLTIRIEDDLKNQAMRRATEIGISLSLVIKNALKNFIEKPVVIIGEVEHLSVTADIQKKMDKVATLLVNK